ncbi:MAG: NAD(P)-dependent oxidoreductase [Candidatus Diapherotrites archaeon]
MKILVTGSQGFIGKELVKELKQRNYEVKEFDLGSGQDLLNEKQVREAVKGSGVVIHLAAIISDEFPKDKFFSVNVKGTENLLEASAKENIRKFIFVSSVGVYGPVKERADEKSELRPQTNYEKSKLEAEALVNSYQEIFPVTILRPALVLGPNVYWKQIIHFIKKEFPLIGEGKNKFQVIYYRDLVQAIVFCLREERTENEVFNVAEENPKTLREIIELIRKELEMKGKIKTIPEWLGTIMACFYITTNLFSKKKGLLIPAHIRRLTKERFYDSGKLMKLGWKPKYGTEEALRETIKELQA